MTSREHLGIQGGSNGGLLVGNMDCIYPQLFQAAVCQVPLLDMRRYHLLLAGASWMAEYGDPDSAGEWDFIRRYSPYQKISRGKLIRPCCLPRRRVMIAFIRGMRKMMAKMEALGQDVTYYENIEGRPWRSGKQSTTRLHASTRLLVLGATFVGVNCGELRASGAFLECSELSELSFSSVLVLCFFFGGASRGV